MVQVTSALLAIAAAAAGLAGVATETPAPTLARTLAYFKPAAAAADEAAAPPPALSKLTQAVTPAPKEVPASKEEPSAVEAYLERAKAFAVEHGKVLGGTLLALVAAVLALGGKKKAETNGSRVAAPVAPVEVTTPKEAAAPPPPTPAQVKQERKELLGPVRKSKCVRPARRYYLLFWPPRRSASVLGALARGVLGLFTRTFDVRTGWAASAPCSRRAAATSTRPARPARTWSSSPRSAATSRPSRCS